MRKILLIQNERYLDRALQDVGSLIAFEQQQIGNNRQVDLLAVLLLPPAAMAQLTSTQQTCDLPRFAGSATPFAFNSVSVNGVWLLLTVSQLPQHLSRREALSRVLSVLRTNECVQTGATVFPVFSLEEEEGSVAEQMMLLQKEHPRLTRHPLLIDSVPGGFLTTSKAVLRSHVE